jgi:hypothetical protein
MTPAVEQRLYAHYQLTTGPRGLYAQRIDGRVALVDAPLEDEGSVYLVERHVVCQAELDGLCAVYIEDSLQADEPGVLASRRRLQRFAEPA